MLVRDGEQSLPAPTEGRWRIEGDWRAALDSFEWLTDYTIARPKGTDAEIDPTRSMKVAATITHLHTLDRNGAYSPGPLLSIWPTGLNQPAALVFIWLVGDKIAHVDVQPVTKPEDFLEFVVHATARFSRTKAELCRLGVAAFVSTGVFTPQPAFGGDWGPRILKSLLLDDPAPLDRTPTNPAAREWRDRHRRPLIFAAAQSGAVRVLDRLLAAQPAMGRATAAETGDTPLHVAACYGRVQAWTCVGSGSANVV